MCLNTPVTVSCLRRIRYDLALSIPEFSDVVKIGVSNSKILVDMVLRQEVRAIIERKKNPPSNKTATRTSEFTCQLTECSVLIAC